MGIKERIEASKKEILLGIESDVRKAALSLKSKIEQKVPVDRGAAGGLKGSWSLIEESPYSFQVVSDAPHAKAVEFGLYPNPPKKGTGKTVDGFSTQAPKGYVRISMEEVINEFE